MKPVRNFSAGFSRKSVWACQTSGRKRGAGKYSYPRDARRRCGRRARRCLRGAHTCEAKRARLLGGDSKEASHSRPCRLSLRLVRFPTEGIRLYGDRTSGFFCGRDLSWSLVRGGTTRSSSIDRRHYVIVCFAVFHDVVDASGALDGFLINLLANWARGSSLGRILRCASVQAVPDGFPFRIGRGGTRIPGEGNLVMAGLRGWL